MKSKKITLILMISSLLTLAIPLVSAAPPSHAKIPNDNPNIPGHLVPGTEAYVYVTTQQKFYRTIVPITPVEGLPHHGPFQILEEAGPSGLQTEFGPGDPGYVGGRWELDTGDGIVYFLCPLLGPALDSIPS
jgi:hypothetical protein